jgi:hypothetical protein
MNVMVNPSSIHNAIAGMVQLNTELLQAAIDHSVRQAQQIEVLTKALAAAKKGDGAANLRSLCVELCDTYRQAVKGDSIVTTDGVTWPVAELREIVGEIAKLVETEK